MRVSRHSFSWRPGLGSVLVVLFLVLAVVGSVFGMYLAGSPEAWDAWLDTHFLAFFAWRACVYSGMAIFWLKLRPHALKREPQARDRIRRLEWTALVLFIASEMAQWMSRG
ncbi:hypothetical protein AO961_16785 [Pseudomonas aeruginosa]|uniref:hypothetical protein n=1 Tax=Pseudomonas aeruginosa TaxID=287 RepID=UPI00071B6A96|nr:hypothetical protein [Pseudomonas aeruginosa]KSG74719.1 hypothetical protein AO961_16785 [Pseudomonas aeruginosa]MCO3916005.1 hypothetical protein [Pseudomonas aeruginosa]HCE6774636.1 hypothetical protein [Pseudomonas aeruginosa]HCW0573905.1 hypothetical protein [Pseudomonas aeruginosa]HCW1032189.1 hypothetical protein [Pseudomonas aeruginosa]